MNRAAKIMSVLVLALLAAGCTTAPKTNNGRAELVRESQEAVAMFRNSDASIERFFQTSVAYAVFPNVTKGGLIVGGAHGQGVLYERGRLTHFCDLTQGTVGLQIGGQVFSEIIFFMDESVVDKFKLGELEIAAQATAVIVSSGAAANVNYSNGAAVFVADQKGAMAEAVLGAQTFSAISANDSMFARDMTRRDDQSYGVYGYANEQDPGWRNDSAYNRQFSAGQPRTLEGEVIAIGDFSPARDAQRGRQLILRANNGETHTVHLGPSAFHDQSDNLRIREGDRVTVLGSATTFQDQHVIMAREIITADNQRLELRDNNGRSRWNMDASRQYPQQPQYQQNQNQQNQYQQNQNQYQQNQYQNQNQNQQPQYRDQQYRDQQPQYRDQPQQPQTQPQQPQPGDQNQPQQPQQPQPGDQTQPQQPEDQR